MWCQGFSVLCAGFGSASTAVAVSQDMHGGIIDRFRSLDVSGAAVLAGHVTASLVRNVASTVLVFGVAFLIGFRSDAGPLGWLAAGGILLLFILTISWLAALVGLLARTPEAANGFTFILMFLPYASSAFVPIATMPTWLQGFSGHQPITPIIESVRGLLNGTPVGNAPWLRHRLVRRHSRAVGGAVRDGLLPPHSLTLSARYGSTRPSEASAVGRMTVRRTGPSRTSRPVR